MNRLLHRNDAAFQDFYQRVLPTLGTWSEVMVWGDEHSVRFDKKALAMIRNRMSRIRNRKDRRAAQQTERIGGMPRNGVTGKRHNGTTKRRKPTVKLARVTGMTLEAAIQPIERGECLDHIETLFRIAKTGEDMDNWRGAGLVVDGQIISPQALLVGAPRKW